MGRGGLDTLPLPLKKEGPEWFPDPLVLGRFIARQTLQGRAVQSRSVPPVLPGCPTHPSTSQPNPTHPRSSRLTQTIVISQLTWPPLNAQVTAMGLRRLAGQGSCPGRPARSVGSASCGVSPRATSQPSNLDADEQKSRCTGDRRRPHCGTCVEAGIICEVNVNRLARGPKKGDLKALRSRIGESNRVHFSGSGMRVQSSNNTALPCTLLI